MSTYTHSENVLFIPFYLKVNCSQVSQCYIICSLRVCFGIYRFVRARCIMLRHLNRCLEKEIVGKLKSIVACICKHVYHIDIA